MIEVKENDVIKAYLNKQFINRILGERCESQTDTINLSRKINTPSNPHYVGDYTGKLWQFMWDKFEIDLRFIHESDYEKMIYLKVTKVYDDFISVRLAYPNNMVNDIDKYFTSYKIPKKNMYTDYFKITTHGVSDEEHNKLINNKIKELEKQLK